jgi:hypothetical protein
MDGNRIVGPIEINHPDHNNLRYNRNGTNQPYAKFIGCAFESLRNNHTKKAIRSNYAFRGTATISKDANDQSL